MMGREIVARVFDDAFNIEKDGSWGTENLGFNEEKHTFKSFNELEKWVNERHSEYDITIKDFEVGLNGNDLQANFDTKAYNSLTGKDEEIGINRSILLTECNPIDLSDGLERAKKRFKEVV